MIRITATAILVLIVCAISAVLVFTARRISSDARSFGHATMTRLAYSAQINSLQAEGYARTLLMLDQDDAAERQKFREQIEQLAQKNHNAVNHYLENISTARGKEIFDDFYEKRRVYGQIRKQILDLADLNKKEEAVRLAQTALWPAYQKYTDAGDVLLNSDIAEGREVAASVEKLSFRIQIMSPLIGIFCFVLGALAPFLTIWLASLWLDEKC